MLPQSIAENVAKAHRCEATVEYTSMVPALVTSPAETSWPWTCRRDPRKGPVSVTNPSMGSEDFALYAAQVPASYFWIGSGGEHPRTAPVLHRRNLHSPGVKLMSEIALRRLNVGRD